MVAIKMIMTNANEEKKSTRSVISLQQELYRFSSLFYLFESDTITSHHLF